jgi:hypothetical protein
MRNSKRNCDVAQALSEIEADCRRKANASTEISTQVCYSVVAIACQQKRFSHEDHCPCCARQMKVAA